MQVEVIVCYAITCTFVHIAWFQKKYIVIYLADAPATENSVACRATNLLVAPIGGTMNN